MTTATKPASVTSWEHLDEQWEGRSVMVRWETGTRIGPDLLSGHPHTFHGTVRTYHGWWVLEAGYDLDIIPPSYAHVVETQR